MNGSSIWVVIPAYNEEQVLEQVLAELRGCNPSYNIVVVDDGSSDRTAEAAEKAGVHVLVHPINLGQGAALASGIEYALEEGAKVVVTFDADGQMEPGDIDRLVVELERRNVDVALGSRFVEGATTPGIPAGKSFTLKLATIFTRMTTGLKLTDTHNGIRAFRADAVRKIKITQNRMAHASEILSEIARNKLRYCEVPVRIRYTEYSRKKGQSLFNTINILYELFMGDKK